MARRLALPAVFALSRYTEALTAFYVQHNVVKGHVQAVVHAPGEIAGLGTWPCSLPRAA